MEEKGFLERVLSKTPKRNRKRGQSMTVLGTVCGAILATGLIVNPIGIVALTVGTIVFGSSAVYHAQKTLK